MEETLKKAVEHYGENNQLIKVAEECSELAQACLKRDFEKIIEESADITIVLEQLKLMDFWDEEEFKLVLNYKARRLSNRIAEEIEHEQREFNWKSN